MTVDHDPMLRSLFAEAREDLGGDEFVAEVMTKVEQAKRASQIRRAGFALLLVIGAWFAAAPLQGAAGWVVLGLAQPIFQPDAGVVAWLLAPINSYTGLSALILLALGRVYSRLFLP